MHANACPALVLNADFRPLSYFPLSLSTWGDAVKAVILGKVSVVAEYDVSVRSPSTEMRLPSVIALRDYQKVDHKVAFTRFNVYLRDRFTCQYCGVKFSASGLTFDHVIPRSKGGETSWTNIVSCCHADNTKKDDRTDMKPMRMPRKPSARDLAAAARAYPAGHLHESWNDYLYWDSELED